MVHICKVGVRAAVNNQGGGRPSPGPLPTTPGAAGLLGPALDRVWEATGELCLGD